MGGVIIGIVNPSKTLPRAEVQPSVSFPHKYDYFMVSSVNILFQ